MTDDDEKQHLHTTYPTDVLEIEDAQGLEREAPPTTDKTHGPKWSMFWREPTNGT